MKGIILLTVSAFIYTIATTIIYFKKNNTNIPKSRLFKKLLLVTIGSMITEFAVVATADMQSISTIMQRLFLVFVILWFSIFTLYSFVITLMDDNRIEEDFNAILKPVKFFLIGLNVILYVLMFILPIDVSLLADGAKYVSGPVVTIVFITLCVYTILMSAMILFNIKDVKKRYIPIIFLIACIIAGGIMQGVYPQLLFTNAVFGFIIFLIYNTIDIQEATVTKDIEIDVVKYNFVEEVQKVVSMNETKIADKSINFKTELAQDIPYELIGDKNHVIEIINNLLSNAVAFTDKGKIELNINCNNEEDTCNLEISVSDTGRGIDKNEIDKLFTIFERLDVEDGSANKGVGLAITKSLIEMMGGTIDVESEVGSGSTFTVHLPQKISILEDPNAVKEQANTEEPEVVEEPVEEEIPIVYEGKKVLIVDDDTLNIKIARRALAEFNFEIDECHNGQECLDKVVNGNEYDLILMDIMMPVMDGETAIQKLKENPNFIIPTMVLTVEVPVMDAREKFINEGFIDYVPKPFTNQQIKEKLDVIFRKVAKEEAKQKKIAEEAAKKEAEESEINKEN